MICMKPGGCEECTPQQITICCKRRDEPLLSSLKPVQCGRSIGYAMSSAMYRHNRAGTGQATYSMDVFLSYGSRSRDASCRLLCSNMVTDVRTHFTNEWISSQPSSRRSGNASSAQVVFWGGSATCTITCSRTFKYSRKEPSTGFAQRPRQTVTCRSLSASQTTHI